MHYTGRVWCATIFELYHKLGRDSNNKHIKEAAIVLTIRLHLMANFNIPATDAKAFQAASEIEAADKNLGGW